MRVIGGKWKGRRLVNFDADHIRPTTDRVKESLFNILQAHWSEAKVLDLFSGTGNLSFECLSRGAREVTSVEKNPKSIEIIKKNQALLNVSKEEHVLVRADVIDYLRSYEREPFNVVLIDPPFTEKMADQVMNEISKSKVAASDTLIVIEWSRHESLGSQYGSIHSIDLRKFGDKNMTIFKVT
jgi:16S rRNA (guanine966-N2)-methyltransferase